MIAHENRTALTKNRVLSPEEALEIRELAKKLTQREVALIYGVSKATVAFISLGYRWKKLTRLSKETKKNTTRRTGTKLTAEEVRTIRKLSSKGKSQNSLAKQFNVSQPVIFDIVHERTWRDA